MAYFLDIIAPGIGHLTARRWFAGPALLLLWFAGLIAAYTAMSFDVRALYVMLGVHPLMATVALAHLLWLRHRSAISSPPWRWSLALLPLVIATLVLGGLFYTNNAVRPVTVRSGSMSPSVVTGDVILVQMFGPLLRGLHLGDVVLIAHPQHSGRLLIKRILGIAGDLIQIRGGEFLRNGRRLSQCQLRSLSDHETHNPVVERLEVLEGRPYLVWDRPAIRSLALDVRVPPGHLFVVGDNRDRSGDSRSFGTVPNANVRGLVTVRIAPVLTNEVYKAPLGARRAASKRCSRQSGQRRSKR